MKEFMKKTLLAVVLMASLMPVVSNAFQFSDFAKFPVKVELTSVWTWYNAETNTIRFGANTEHGIKNPKTSKGSGWDHDVHQYSKLMKLYGQYITVDGWLDDAGIKLTFEYKNLPPSPNITMSWGDLYHTFYDSFRLYNEKLLDITTDDNAEIWWHALDFPKSPNSEITGAKLHYTGASGIKLQLDFSHSLYGDPTLFSNAHDYDRDAFTLNDNNDFFKVTIGNNRKTLWFSHNNIPSATTLKANLSKLKESLKKYYANYDGKISSDAQTQFDNLSLPLYDGNASTMKNISASDEDNVVKIDIEFDRILSWKNEVATTAQLNELLKVDGLYVGANVIMTDLNAGNKNLRITYRGNVERSTMTIDLGDLRASLSKIFTNFYPHVSSHLQAQIDTLDLPRLKPSTMQSIQASTSLSGNSKSGTLDMTFDKDLVWSAGFDYGMGCSLTDNACQVVKVNGGYVNITLSSSQNDDRKKLALIYTIMTEDSTVTVNLADLKAYLSKVLYNFSGDLTDAAKAQFDSLEFPKSFELQMQEKSIKAERDTEIHTQTAHTAKETTKSATTVADGFAAKNDAIEAANKAEESANDVSETDTTRKQSANANAQLAKEHAEAAKVAFKELYESKAIQGNWKTPVIKGLGYSTDIYSYEGKTNNKGMYRCQSGEMVTFSLGYIKIAEVTCPPAVTLVSVPE